MKRLLLFVIASTSVSVPALSKEPAPMRKSEIKISKVTAEKKPLQRSVLHYSILSKSSGYALAISTGSTKSGSAAIEWTNRLSDEQQWRLKPIESEWFQIIAKHSNKALTARASEKNPIVQGSTTAGKTTHWKFQSDSDGFARIINRESKLALEIEKTNGSHGNGILQKKRADTDRQKWKIEVAEFSIEESLPFEKLALPAREIIGKKHPKTSDELRDFLHGTTWSIRYESRDAKEEYKMTFDKAGTLKLNSGRVSKLEILGPNAIRLWDYDSAILSNAFNYFQSVDANRNVYYGVLLPPNP